MGISSNNQWLNQVLVKYPGWLNNVLKGGHK